MAMIGDLRIRRKQYWLQAATDIRRGRVYPVAKNEEITSLSIYVIVMLRLEVFM